MDTSISPAVTARINRAKIKERSDNFPPELFLCHSTDAGDVGAEVEVGAKVEVVQKTPTTATVGTMTEQLISANSFLSLTEKKPIITREMLMHDEKALHFYTRLEIFSKLTFVFQSLGPAAYQLNYFFGSISKPKVKDQFLLVLMKLRQRMCNYELALMFRIEEKEVYNIFVTWVRFMSLQWQETDLWPSNLVQFYSPEDFFF